MEMDDDNPVEAGGDYVEIYSRKAIFWFAVLADPLFGGILLIINLWVAGYKKAVGIIAIFLIAYEAITTKAEYWYIAHYQIDPKKIDNNTLVFLAMSKGFQIAGGAILAGYFYKKYFPENDYFPRSIISPLLITVFIILILGYSGISF